MDWSEQELKQANFQTLKQETAPIEYTYIDLMCLKDFRLGALLHCLIRDNDHEGYRHVLDNLSTYNNRLDRELMCYFPKLTYTEQDITDCITDPQYADKIFALAPTTKFYETLPKVLTGIKAHNDRTDRSMASTIAINIYPLARTKLIERRLMAVLKCVANNFRLAMVTKPLKHMTPTTLFNTLRGGLLFKLFFVWDPMDMLATDGKLRDPMATDRILQDARIFGAKKLQLPVSQLPPTTNWEENFGIIADYFNIISLFSYMDYGIPFPESSSQD